MNDLVTVKNLSIFHETDKAYGVIVHAEDEPDDIQFQFWLPKSQVDMIRDKKGSDENLKEFDIPKWLAEKNDLDYED